MYYKHSGKFGLGGLFVGVFTGAPAALLLAYAYAHGLPLIPEAHFAMFATLAFGALIGLATGYGLALGKVRNEPIAVALTAVISAAALYVSWAMWVAITLETQHIRTVDWMELAQRPAALWNVICLINRYGTWGLGSGSNTTGWELWGYWIAEASAVLGAAIGVEFALLNRHAFCETCDRWCTRGAKIVLAAPQNLPQLKLQVEAGDLHPLETLEAGNKSIEHLTVALDSCTQCHQFHTLSLTHTTITRDKLGRATIKNKMIVQHLLVGVGQADVVHRLSEKMGQTPKVTATAAGKK